MQGEEDEYLCIKFEPEWSIDILEVKTTDNSCVENRLKERALRNWKKKIHAMIDKIADGIERGIRPTKGGN